MQNIKLIINHWWHFCLMMVILALTGIVLVIRTPSAITGILWVDDSHSKTIENPTPVDRNNLKINFGVYDYAGTMSDNKNIAIEHVFIDWNDFDQTEYLGWVSELQGRGRWPLVTIEPFSREVDRENRLLSDVIEKQYDQEIISICKTIYDLGQPTFVRWGHEMERVTGRYPWAQNDGGLYVSAYRHVVDLCRAQTISESIFFVWSPVGNNELATYWPGREYVDYVGVSVYAFDEWELANYGYIRSFDEIFSPKYELVKAFERPVMIAELGVNGKSDFQVAWFNEMLASVNNYPLLKSVVYFNAIDSVDAWGADYVTPNWEIPASVFDN